MISLLMFMGIILGVVLVIKGKNRLLKVKNRKEGLIITAIFLGLFIVTTPATSAEELAQSKAQMEQAKAQMEIAEAETKTMQAEIENRELMPEPKD